MTLTPFDKTLAALRSTLPAPGWAETCQTMKEVADDVVCAHSPEQFAAVGLWYEDFSQTTDEEVRELLAAAARPANPERKPEVARNMAGA